MIKTHWNVQLAYRMQFLLSVISTPLRFFVIVAIWTAVFLNNGGEKINGYSLESLIFYYILASISYSITITMVGENLESLIRNGNIIQFLLKPIHFFNHLIAEHVARRGLVVLIEIIPTIIIFLLLFSKYMFIGNIFVYSIFIIVASMMNFFLVMTMGFLGFWFISTRSFRWLMSYIISILSGTMIPIDLFPQSVSNVLYYLPFKFLSYVPIKAYLGEIPTNQIFGLILLQLMWLIILIIIALVVWKIGVKKICGEGT